MIATGTDVKPLECLIFMRTVKSRNFFEQMKGRGVRVVSDAELQGVSPGAVPRPASSSSMQSASPRSTWARRAPSNAARRSSLKALFEKIATGSTRSQTWCRRSPVG